MQCNYPRDIINANTTRHCDVVGPYHQWRLTSISLPAPTPSRGSIRWATHVMHIIHATQGNVTMYTGWQALCKCIQVAMLQHRADEQSKSRNKTAQEQTKNTLRTGKNTLRTEQKTNQEHIIRFYCYRKIWAWKACFEQNNTLIIKSYKYPVLHWWAKVFPVFFSFWGESLGRDAPTKV